MFGTFTNFVIATESVDQQIVDIALKDINNLSVALDDPTEMEFLVKIHLIKKFMSVSYSHPEVFSDSHYLLCNLSAIYSDAENVKGENLNSIILPMIENIALQHGFDIGADSCEKIIHISEKPIRKPNFRKIDQALKDLQH